MQTQSSYQQVPLSACVPARFSSWRGASGRRYVFTRLDPGSLDDFSDGVAIAVRGGLVIWAGEVAVLAHMPLTAWIKGATLHVHLIAASDAERRLVVDDMRPSERMGFKLAA